MGVSKEAVETLRKNNIKRYPCFLLQFLGYSERESSGQGITAIFWPFRQLGHMQEDHLDGVLFDHLMLEAEQKHISNYSDLTTLTSADLMGVPHIMVEWLVHMAINAGVTSTAARSEIWKNQKN